MAINLTKIKENNNIVELFSNKKDTIEMNISEEAYSHIIDRLTDLYSDPLSATIRETISNGLDAIYSLPKSKQADKKVYVTLPTKLAPVLEIKDEGIGMSLNTVKEIYSKYGASTKRVDFSQIGAYGLGAKAPLAYTTQFSVKTTQNGITTDFSVSRSSGKNKVEIFSSEKTDLSDGTIVTIPIFEEDVYKCHNSKTNGFINHFFPNNKVVFTNLENKYPRVFEDMVTFNIPVSDNINLKGAISFEKLMSFDNISKISYILGGWEYATDSNWRPYPSILVEIIPGIVDFSSSRDSIIYNHRESELRIIITKYLLKNKTTLINKFLKEVSVYHWTPALHSILNGHITGLEMKEGNLQELISTAPKLFSSMLRVENKSWAVFPYKSILTSSSYHRQQNLREVKDKLWTSEENFSIFHILKHLSFSETFYVVSSDGLTEKQFSKMQSSVQRLISCKKNFYLIITPFSLEKVKPELDKTNLNIDFLTFDDLLDLIKEKFPRKERQTIGNRAAPDYTLEFLIVDNNFDKERIKSSDLQKYIKKDAIVALLEYPQHSFRYVVSVYPDAQQYVLINPKELKALHAKTLMNYTVVKLDRMTSSVKAISDLYSKALTLKMEDKIYKPSCCNSIYSSNIPLTELSLPKHLLLGLKLREKDFYVGIEYSDASEYIDKGVSILQDIKGTPVFEKYYEVLKKDFLENIPNQNWGENLLINVDNN